MDLDTLDWRNPNPMARRKHCWVDHNRLCHKAAQFAADSWAVDRLVAERLVVDS